MAKIERFEDIEAWKKARELAKEIYAISNEGLFSRDFGLRDQIRRAAVSVMSNIAEGFESQSRMLFISFLYRARGSAAELRAQAYVALDSRHIDGADFDRIQQLSHKCGQQLYRFIEYLRHCPDR